MVRYSFILLLSAGTLMFSFGATPAGAQWRHYTNTDDIRAIHRQGDILWIGTNGGLLSYDLLTGEMSVPGEIAERLPSQSVRAIAQSGGTLYIGTDNGLLSAGANGIKTYTSDDRSYFSDVRRISFGFTGGLYLGTFGFGAVRLVDDKSFAITKEDSLLDNKVYSVYQPDAKSTYFATSLGLCAFIDEAWVNYQAGYGLPRGEVLSIEPIDRHEFYVLIREKGIYRFDGKRARRIPLEGHFKEQDIAAIAVANDGSLWAAGRFGELRSYRYGDWVAYDESNPEVRNARWRCAHANSSGDLFFGTADGLIARFKAGKLTTFTIGSQLPSNMNSLLAEDPSRALLVKSGGSLVRVSNAGIETIEIPGHLVALAVAPDSSLWFSTRWGLFRRTGRGIREMTPEVAGLNSYFTALSFDSTGNLWAGSFSGVIYRFDGEMWLPYGGTLERSGGSIDFLAADAHNRLWALSRSSGVSMLEAGEWHWYSRTAFEDDSLRTLAIDAGGTPVVLGDSGRWRYSAVDGWSRQDTLKTIGYLEVMTFDSKGTCIAGSKGALYFLSAKDVREVELPGMLHNAGIAALLVDSRETLWIGFKHGGLAGIPLADLQ